MKITHDNNGDVLVSGPSGTARVSRGYGTSWLVWLTNAVCLSAASRTEAFYSAIALMAPFEEVDMP